MKKRVIDKVKIGRTTELSFMRPALMNKKGFGINEVIGIAAGIIIAAVVIIPGLKVFSGTVMTQLSTWWSSLASDIFQG